ncbi:MAG: hypothetical protein MUE83_16125 [Tabrizicola sp.]|jgi:hypothetical protein|nr:hypothetical protein [Tabrizicola sp.]
MPAAKYWRKKSFLFKIETTYGVDSVPTGVLNAILATDVKFQPMEGTDVNRNLDLPYLGAQGTIPNELHAKFSCKVELAPSGTAGTAPAWGPMLRACACAQVVNAGVSVVYNPITDNHESATLKLTVDGTLFQAVGVRGNAKMTINAQGIPYLEFEFTGLFVQPIEQANPAVTLTAFRPPRVASAANTPTFRINGVDLVMRTFEMDLGNKVEPRFLVGVGAEQILITQREEMIKTQVEAQPLTAINPFALAAAQTAVAVNLTHGIGAGNIATLAVPTAQMQRPQGMENAQDIMEWPLSLMPLPSGAGNNQWTLTLT